MQVYIRRLRRLSSIFSSLSTEIFFGLSQRIFSPRAASDSLPMESIYNVSTSMKPEGIPGLGCHYRQAFEGPKNPLFISSPSPSSSTSGNSAFFDDRMSPGPFIADYGLLNDLLTNLTIESTPLASPLLSSYHDHELGTRLDGVPPTTSRRTRKTAAVARKALTLTFHEDEEDLRRPRRKRARVLRSKLREQCRAGVLERIKPSQTRCDICLQEFTRSSDLVRHKCPKIPCPLYCPDVLKRHQRRAACIAKQ